MTLSVCVCGDVCRSKAGCEEVVEDDKSLVLRPELMQAYARRAMTTMRDALVQVSRDCLAHRRRTALL